MNNTCEFKNAKSYSNIPSPKNIIFHLKLVKPIECKLCEKSPGRQKHYKNLLALRHHCMLEHAIVQTLGESDDDFKHRKENSTNFEDYLRELADDFIEKLKEDS